jgi:methylglutaconyl-CoA hydratase
MDTAAPVLLTCDARGVATLTLNRPDKRNAFDASLVAQLHQAIDSVAKDQAVRIVVLTGAGGHFCAGADLEHMRRQGTMSEAENYQDALNLALCLQALDALPMPVIARVNGSAYGGAIGLIACADIAVGIAPAKFALTEARLGIAPATISPYVIAAIGARQARYWFLSAATLDTQAAHRIGLLHHVAEESQLDAVVEAQLELLLRCGPAAQRASKQLVKDVIDWQHLPPNVYGEQIPVNTAKLLARLRSSTEGKEGLAAFLANRKPYWNVGK